MFESLMFATDFSEHSLKALRVIPQFSRIGLERVYVLRVINLNRVVGVAGGVNIDEYIAVCAKEAEVRLEEISRRIREMGVEAIPVKPVPAGDPVKEIVERAEKLNVSAIIMGSRGRGLLKEILLGSVSEGVVKRSKVPVFVVKGDVDDVFERMVFAHDLREHSDLVTKYVKYIAERVGSEVVLVHVIEKREMFDENRFNSVKEELSGVKLKTFVREGVPHKEIIRVCDEVSATSLFIGGGIPETISEKLLGSTADALLRHSKIPVFVAKS